MNLAVGIVLRQYDEFLVGRMVEKKIWKKMENQPHCSKLTFALFQSPRATLNSKNKETQ